MDHFKPTQKLKKKKVLLSSLYSSCSFSNYQQIIQTVYAPTDFPLLHYFQVNFTNVISATNISVFFLKDKDDFLKHNYNVIIIPKN